MAFSITFRDLVWCVQVLVLTWSTLPLRHTVTEHCTNYYVTLHHVIHMYTRALLTSGTHSYEELNVSMWRAKLFFGCIGVILARCHHQWLTRLPAGIQTRFADWRSSALPIYSFSHYTRGWLFSWYL